MSTGEELFELGEKISSWSERAAKDASVSIAAPALVFGGPVRELAADLHRNQGNPGDVIKAGAKWIQLAERQRAASEKLADRARTVTDEHWKGADAGAFGDASDEVADRLDRLAAEATRNGVRLVELGTSMAAYCSHMAASAREVQACFDAYLAALRDPGSAAGAPALRQDCERAAAAMSDSARHLAGRIEAKAADRSSEEAEGPPPVLSGARLPRMVRALASYTDRSDRPGFDAVVDLEEALEDDER
ncbi:hypothetical protein [Glycomyces xiaoerkulensis]|uniref:hypothetical protein n=1 Tax=Glycomyces xiaoerkulensis TaxID=2038139 RepID=UPI000C262F6D|nr:hypothetical protein [Glycomyces xiaoerkulensis]